MPVPQLTDWLAELDKFLREGDWDSAQQIAGAIRYRAKQKGLWMTEYEMTIVSIGISTIDMKGDQHGKE